MLHIAYSLSGGGSLSVKLSNHTKRDQGSGMYAPTSTYHWSVYPACLIIFSNSLYCKK